MKDFYSSFFNPTTEKLPPARGSLLVAQPFLSEEWFERSVISLIDYESDKGATGLVLNHRTDLNLSDVIRGVDDFGARVPIYCGGPMGHDRLFFIHNLGSDVIRGAECYAPDLYIGDDLNSAIEYVRDGYPIDGCIRFVVGYSGWSRGQLEDELSEDTWASVADDIGSADLLSGYGEDYWQRIVRMMGQQYKSWLMIPRNAIFN